MSRAKNTSDIPASAKARRSNSNTSTADIGPEPVRVQSVNLSSRISARAYALLRTEANARAEVDGYFTAMGKLVNEAILGYWGARHGASLAQQPGRKGPVAAA